MIPNMRLIIFYMIDTSKTWTNIEGYKKSAVLFLIMIKEFKMICSNSMYHGDEYEHGYQQQQIRELRENESDHYEDELVMVTEDR